MSNRNDKAGQRPVDESAWQEALPGIRMKEPGEHLKPRPFAFDGSVRQNASDIKGLLSMDNPQAEKAMLTNPLATTGSIIQTRETTQALQDIDANRGREHFRPDESGKRTSVTAEQQETATVDGVVLPFSAFVGAAVGEEANHLGNGKYLQWEPPGLQKAGKNPDNQRQFVGDEFPRMLAYGAPKFKIGKVKDPDTGEENRTVLGLLESAKPAFYSYSKDGKSAPEKINIVIATSYETMPEYMKSGDVAATMAAREDFAFEGQSLEEAFSATSEKIRKAYEIAAKDVTAFTGIEFDIRLDTDPNPHKEEDVNITLLGFKNGNERLAGFASFPEAVNDWEDLNGLGHKQGFALVNTDYCDHPTISPYKIYDLMVHEGGGIFGHNLGLVHPHDLGTMNMSQAEALSATVMSYTDNVFCGPNIFNEKGELCETIIKGSAPDEADNAIIYELNADKRPGVMCGVADYGIRNYCPKAPKVTGIDNLKYDMTKARDYNLSLHNKGKRDTLHATKMPAFLPIDATGKNTTLYGTENDDVIDTEPGHVSRSSILGNSDYEQRFVVTAGHIDIVKGREGNNKIFLSSKGDQLVQPGFGSNTVYMYAEKMDGAKTIESRGGDTLVLHESLFLGEGALEAQREQDRSSKNRNDLVLGDRENGLIIKDQFSPGKGFATIKVVSEDGKELLSHDVRNFRTVTEFQNEIVKAAQRSIKRNQKSAEAGEDLNGHDHGDAPVHDHSLCNPLGPYTARVGSSAARSKPERTRPHDDSEWKERIGDRTGAVSTKTTTRSDEGWARH